MSRRYTDRHSHARTIPSLIGRMLSRHGVPFLSEHLAAVVDHGLMGVWHPGCQLTGHAVLIA